MKLFLVLPFLFSLPAFSKDLLKEIAFSRGPSQIISMRSSRRPHVEKPAKTQNLSRRKRKRHIELTEAVLEGSLLQVARLVDQRGLIDINRKDRQGRTIFHLAVLKGHEEIVKYLLKNEAHPEIKGEHGETVFHLAASSGKLEVMEVLLSNPHLTRKLINEKDEYGRTALHICAASPKKTEMARLLIEKGADINATNALGESPLHVALQSLHSTVQRKKARSVFLLLEKGANIEIADSRGFTPLRIAVEKELFSVVEKLLSLGADVNSKDGTGMTAIFEASHPKILEALIEKGALVNEIDQRGKTALHWASGRGDVRGVKLLIENGAKVDVADSWGWTPLHWAVHTGRLDVVETLLENGAPINMRDHQGKTVAHLALSSGGSYKKISDILSLLLERNVDIDARDNEGQTPLHFSLQMTDTHQKNLAIFSFLVAKGARVDIKDINQRTVSHLAALEKNLDALEVLEKSNMNEQDKDGNTPLHLIAERIDFFWEKGAIFKHYLSRVLKRGDLGIKNDKGETPVIIVKESLVRNKTHLNTKDEEGITPLHWAAKENLTLIVEALLKAGAKPELRDHDGKTPWDLTTSPSVKKLLEEAI